MEHSRISHYEIGRRIGIGGMAEVYEAVDLDLDRRVALKFITPELASDRVSLKRFEREARSIAALNHPHIATLFAFEQVASRPFIAMELVRGVTLRQRIQAGPMPVAEALAVARDAAEALALAHRLGIVHRDIKPENLMFDENGSVKVMDFGLARAAFASRITVTGSTVGTPAYMPPESLNGVWDSSSDVFSLGVVLYEMLAGAAPFTGVNVIALLSAIANETPRPLREFRPEAPEVVEKLVCRMLAKASDERPDAARVAIELGTLTGVSVDVRDGEEPSHRGAAPAFAGERRRISWPARRILWIALLVLATAVAVMLIRGR